jgi:CHAD domain-containing protein
LPVFSNGLAHEDHIPEVAGQQMKQEGQDLQEVEWQFDALDVRPVNRWLEGDSWGRDPAVATGETREISDGYFETDDWRIYRAGYALRIRRTDGKKVEATMKRLASANGETGLKWRREISEPLDDADPETLNDSPGPVGDRVRALTGPEALRPLFEVRTRRSIHHLMLDGFRVGEVAIDETAIPLEEDEPARLRRVEVEVEPEFLDRLEPFVGRLREECRLSPAVASKYESGLFARGITPPAPPDFGPTRVDGTLSTGEFAFRILRIQFGIFLAHEPGTRIGEDPEELHDMRVATRRMRAAMKIFEDALPARTRAFRDSLQWVAGALGEVRDIDVQLGHLEGWISEAAPEDKEPLTALRAVLEGQRAKARKAMLRVLDSRRYARLVTSFAAFLRKGPSLRAAGARQPVMEAAPGLLRKPYRKVRKLGDPLTEESSGEEFHELRKKGKRLRYALEFLSGIYGEPMKEFIGPLKELQDVLGDHQDAEVATTHLRELSVARGRGRRLPPETIFVMGGISHRYDLQARELSTQFPKEYRKAVRRKWKKIRGVMEKANPER